MNSKYLGHPGGLIGPVEMEKPHPVMDEAGTEYWHNKVNAYNQHLSGLPRIPCQGWKPEVWKEYEEWVQFKKQKQVDLGNGWVNTHDTMYDRFPEEKRRIVAVPIPAAQPSPELDHPEEEAAYLQPAPAANDGGDGNTDGTIIQFLLGSHSFRGKWFGEKTEGEPPFWWRSILRKYAEGGFKYDMPSPTYPAEFVEWVFDNCILLEGRWYMWKKGPGSERSGGVKFTLAELFAGPYQSGQNNRGIIMATDPLDNSVNMITTAPPEPVYIVPDDTRAKALADVDAERNRQNSIWGEQNHTPAEWLAILGEEFGEVCKAVYEVRHSTGNLDNYREELVQVAAVAVQMIECYDRNGSAEPAIK